MRWPAVVRKLSKAAPTIVVAGVLKAAGNPKTRSNLLKSFRNTVDGMTGSQPGKSFTAEQGALLKLLSTRL
jgi:hypothetical protein